MGNMRISFREKDRGREKKRKRREGEERGEEREPKLWRTVSVSCELY